MKGWCMRYTSAIAYSDAAVEPAALAVAAISAITAIEEEEATAKRPKAEEKHSRGAPPNLVLLLQVMLEPKLIQMNIPQGPFHK